MNLKMLAMKLFQNISKKLKQELHRVLTINRIYDIIYAVEYSMAYIYKYIHKGGVL